MKKLENQTLIYDEDCPICNIYTSKLIKAGIVDENGRKPYSEIKENEEIYVDLKRATNEIALVDSKNKTVLYGIDGLLKVFGHSYPSIEKIGTIKPINYVLKKMYKFISYNRKVIAPSKEKKSISLKYIPDFNYKYRLLYIAFTSTITILVLYYYSNLFSFLPKTNINRELLLIVGQMVFQGMFLIHLKREKIMNYLGNLTTVSFIGSLLLLPILVISMFLKIPETLSIAWFGATTILMLLEHYRRTKILELPFHLNITWIAFSIIALLLILNLNK
ncbi:hypothetical protein [Flavobacterium sp.]|uniref:hypothetical protein n=1 Tax=Flavobacterium sp. TaxID=239 RepID=UPI003BCC161A